MRYLVSGGVAAAFFFGALAGFWRSQQLARRELGVLTGQVDSKVADWESKKVPAGGRVFNFVISDAGSGPDPFVLPEEPGFLAKAMAWLKSGIVGGKPAAAEPTAFAKSFAGLPDTVVWTHEGFSTASEEAMTREIAKAVVKAHDAGAQVNIVTQGVSASPALKALKSLEGAVRGGRKVQANKVVLVGMNPAGLKRIAPVFFMDFTKPGNVLELADIHTQSTMPPATVVQLFGKNHSGTEYGAEDLWPELASQGSAPADLIKIVKDLTSKVESLEQVIGQLAQAASGRAEEAKKRAVTMKNLDGYYVRKEGSGPALARPQRRDSMSMIKGGEEYSQSAVEAAAAVKAAEEARAAKAAADAAARESKAADENARAAMAAVGAALQPAKRKEPSADDIVRWKQEERVCERCCADVGLSWRKAAYTGGVPFSPRGPGGSIGNVDELQDYWGCCRKSGPGPADLSRWGALPSCRAARRDEVGGDIMVWFICLSR
ncbi:MAG: hypothetical protein HY927_08000 [Elusimicrobia bacterium]|nr:hypothetical protein [Elusimicrobiota bacterium]